MPERTEWHSIYLWRRLAEIVERYVHKGDKLYVEGELRYRTYTDKKGATHKITEIWASNIEMLTPRSQNAAPQANNSTTTSQATQANPFPTSNAGTDNNSKLPF